MVAAPRHQPELTQTALCDASVMKRDSAWRDSKTHQQSTHVITTRITHRAAAAAAAAAATTCYHS